MKGVRKDACGRGGLARTISRRTSPTEKDSPSLFFQEAMPPSIMVGLMAGIANLERACLRAEVCRPVGEEVKSGDG